MHIEGVQQLDGETASHMHDSSLKTISLLGLSISSLEYSQVFKYLKNQIKLQKKTVCAALNLDVLRLTYRDYEYFMAIKGADLIFADGMPIVWLSQIQKTPLAERIAGSDLVLDLCKDSDTEEYNIYFLGAAPGIAQKAEYLLRKKYPGIRVVGTYAPEPWELQNELASINIINHINAKNTDILFVALGAPKQELWISKYRDKIDAFLIFPCGGSIDFIAGAQRKAPKWVGRIGFEWLYRLISNPGKFYQRYLLHDIPFYVNVLLAYLLNITLVRSAVTEH